MHRRLTGSLVLAAMLVAPMAAANGTNCPPGNWFCDPAPAPSSPQGGPGNAEAPKEPPAPPAAPAPPVAAVPAVPAPHVVPMPVRRRAVPAWYQRNQVGISLRFAGVILGAPRHAGMASTEDDRGMFGGGAGVRWRPLPQVALQADVDYFVGRDYQGMRRNEYGSSLNAYAFLTPRSPAQFYLLVGAGWSRANVTDGEARYEYSYFGGQVGLGLEYRATRNFAVNGDLRGFIRTRVDPNATAQPEFRDENGRTTNTSGGGLFTLGTTFYF